MVKEVKKNQTALRKISLFFSIKIYIRMYPQKRASYNPIDLIYCVHIYFIVSFIVTIFMYITLYDTIVLCFVLVCHF